MIRKKARHLRLGLQTLLTPYKRGYFIPYRYAQQTPQKSSYHFIQDFFESQSIQFQQNASFLDKYAQDFLTLEKSSAYHPDLSQSWFPYFDAAFLYSFIRHHRPQMIVEIGAGHSTRFTLSALADNQMQSSFISIDPRPRESIPQIHHPFINFIHHQAILQKIGISLFNTLSAGDILFIDSSHILHEGSDVDLLLSEILPILKKGVIIHIHDIFLPDAYPQSWKWRGYNEQSSFIPLLASKTYIPLWASHYLLAFSKSLFPESLLKNVPDTSPSYPSSLWLYKK